MHRPTGNRCVLPLLLLLYFAEMTVCLQSKGPEFLAEPPHHGDFSNSTGIRLDCAAHGNPPPTIKWTLADGTPIGNINGIRTILRNGTLLFHPFDAKDYRQDVHATTYRCSASNPLGVVFSRDVRMRAVVKQVYEVQVYDEYVIKGNTAVMKCHIPSFVTEYVQVISWIQVETSSTYSGVDLGSRYSVMPTGELHIQGVNSNDALIKSYRCRTLNRLTGEVRESSTTGRLIVTDPRGSVQPRITDSQSVINVRQNEKIVLPCAAQGYPLPTYSWFAKVSKDQLVLVTISDRLQLFSGSLVIPSVQISDGGTYICVVNNSVGVEKVETSLYVTVPLSAYIEPQQQVADLGQPAHFDCIVSGVPVTSVLWLKDGRPLRFDNRIQQQSRDSVHIEGIRREDRGMYQCHVRNEMEYVQGSSELRLGDAAPEILDRFAEKTLQPGTGVSLTCAVSGNPPPKITWSLDGSVVGTTKDGSLTVSDTIQNNADVVSQLNISYVKTEDGGIYRCIAHNRGGSAEYSARLNVYGPPSIRPMSKIAIVAGDIMIVSCPVAGYPIDSITWEKDGINLPVNHRQTVHRNGTLVVHLVQRTSDSGTYSCVARSNHGDVARQDVDVMVMVPPLLTPISFQDDHLYEGAHARVTCGVTGGDLPISFEWRKDGHLIPSNVGITIRDVDEYSNILTISSVAPQHSGNYTCIASNGAASSNYTASLTVNVPPRWLLEPVDTEASIGDSIMLHCQAHGFPKPTAAWKKAVGDRPGNYKEILSDGFHKKIFGNGSLFINGVSETDRGYYLCQLNNNIGGGLSKVILLNIHIAAHFTIKHRNYTVAKGDTAHLVCEAVGNLPIMMTWKMNKEKTFVQGRPRFQIQDRKATVGMISELTIEQVDRSDSATFNCYANNVYGKDETAIQLIVQEQPDCPLNIRIVDHSSRSVQLAWTAPYNGNSPIIKYVVQYKKLTDSWLSQSQNMTVSGSQTIASVTNLSPANAYHLRILAVNNVGISVPSEALILTSADEAPGGPPKNVKVQAVDSRSLKISWEPPRKSDWHGSIQGYYVGYKSYESSGPYVFNTVEMRDLEAQELSQHLTNLMKYSKYSIVVQAFNRLGSGPKSDEIVAMTSEDVPELPPLGVQCSPLTSQSLHVSWEPPSSSSINGILLGYKVFYSPVHDEYTEGSSEVKITTATKTILHGLSKFTNYSIQVLAYTAVGDGVMTNAVYCRTGEDVPDAPAGIKVVVMSMDSIVVTWKPPLQPNGIITKYTVYVRNSQDENEETAKHVVPPNGQYYFETTGLKPNRRYEFWVTASTAFGEGESTKVLSEVTGKKVPGRIVSLSDSIVTPWKKIIKLPCRTVGAPAPEVEWFNGTQKLEIRNGGRVRIEYDGTLMINGILIQDVGNYTCTTRNIYGTDAIYYNITVLAPPSAPLLILSSAHLSTIDLKWKPNAASGITPIQGYYLNYKREYGEWEEIVVDKKEESYTLKNLWCGSRYQIYLNAFNKIGTGEPSPILTTKTKGFAPEKPPKSLLLRENSTLVVLHLDEWKSGGCPVLYFVVEYKPVKNKHWILVSNNVKPSQTRFVIQDLKPQSWYSIRITAHNSAGSAIVEHSFVTRTLSGGTVPPEMVRDQEDSQFVIDFRVIISIGASIFVIIASLALVCLCIRRQRSRERREKAEDIVNGPTTPKAYAVNTNNHNIPSLAQEKGSFTMLLSNSGVGQHRNYSTSASTENFKKVLDCQDDICPYATFPIPPGHVRDGQYPVHVKPYNHGQNTNYTPNHTSTYAKVQKLSANSQTSGNIGNLQIQKDYGSPVSESDVSELTTSPLVDPFLQQLHDNRQNIPARLEHRVPDLLYHKPESSSTETSPDIERRIYHRPGRTRCRNTLGDSKQAHPDLSEDSQDSNSEEAKFSFNRKLDPALFYSDSHEFSEAECDRDRRYKYIEELKNQHYERNYIGAEDSTLLVRR